MPPPRASRDRRGAAATGGGPRGGGRGGAAATGVEARASSSATAPPPRAARGSPTTLDRRRRGRARVAEDEPRLDRAVVAVDLEPDGGVDGLARARPGSDAAAPERDAARARAARREREGDVAPLPHRRAGRRAARSARAAPARGCPSRTGASRSSSSASPRCERVAGHDGVDPLARHEVLRRAASRAACADERLAERVDAPARDRQARRRAVAAVAQQVGARRVEPAEQVEGRDRAPGAGALLAVERDQHRRPVVALGDPRGDDADHARDASRRRPARRPPARRRRARGRPAPRPRTGSASRRRGARR